MSRRKLTKEIAVLRGKSSGVPLIGGEVEAGGGKNDCQRKSEIGRGAPELYRVERLEGKGGRGDI